jgi:hypothetical protein
MRQRLARVREPVPVRAQLPRRLRLQLCRPVPRPRLAPVRDRLPGQLQARVRLQMRAPVCRAVSARPVQLAPPPGRCQPLLWRLRSGRLTPSQCRWSPWPGRTDPQVWMRRRVWQQAPRRLKMPADRRASGRMKTWGCFHHRLRMRPNSTRLRCRERSSVRARLFCQSFLTSQFNRRAFCAREWRLQPSRAAKAVRYIVTAMWYRERVLSSEGRRFADTSRSNSGGHHGQRHPPAEHR